MRLASTNGGSVSFMILPFDCHSIKYNLKSKSIYKRLFNENRQSLLFLLSDALTKKSMAFIEMKM
jgi:hypothetical protein